MTRSSWRVAGGGLGGLEGGWRGGGGEGWGVCGWRQMQRPPAVMGARPVLGHENTRAGTQSNAGTIRCESNIADDTAVCPSFCAGNWPGTLLTGHTHGSAMIGWKRHADRRKLRLVGTIAVTAGINQTKEDT